MPASASARQVIETPPSPRRVPIAPRPLRTTPGGIQRWAAAAAVRDQLDLARGQAAMSLGELYTGP